MVNSFSCRGSSLLETLIALLIFAIAMIPVFDLIKSGAVRARNSMQENIVSSLAAELIEQLSCMPFDSVPIVNDLKIENSDNGCWLGKSHETFLVISEAAQDIRRKLTIKAVSPFLKQVSVEIEFGTTPRRISRFSTFLEWQP